MSLATDFQAAVEQTDADSDIFHDIVHGPASGEGSTVTTESGAQPTIAKAIADGVGSLSAAVTAAETAETNAETAETNAETAETNAATSATTATTQAGIATTQAGNAATSATTATTQAGIATTQATNAATSATTATTQAGIATTQAGNAATSASTATTQATNASTSATLASDWATKTSGLVAATDYSAKEFAIGTQASTGGSAKNWAQQTGADVTGAAANSRSAKSWAQDNNTGATLGGSAKDWAQSGSKPDGTSESAKTYATQAAASAASVNATYLASADSGRAPRGGINYQGCNSYSSLGSNVAGTDDFTLTWVMDVPTVAPATTGVPVSLANTTSGDGGSGVQFMVQIPGATQNIRVAVFKSGFGSRREWDATTALITNYGGKRITCAVTRAGTTVKFYINGGLINSETHADWATDLTAAPYFIQGTNWGSNYYGNLYGAAFYNFALSAAEALENHELGGVPAERFKWGSYTSTIDTAFANAGLDTFSGGSLTGFTSAIYSSGSGTKGAESNGNYTSPVYPLQVGTRLRLKFTATLNSGAVPTLRVGVGGGADYVTAVAIANGANILDMPVTSVPSYQGMNIKFYTTANANYSVANFTIIKLGAVVFLPMDDGIGFQLHDASTNKLDATITLGGLAQGLYAFNHIIPDKRGFVRGTLTWAGTHEGKSLLGQRALPNGAVVTLLTLKPTASSSGSGTTVGSTTTAARWRAAAAVTANTKSVATLANQLPAGTANNDTDILVDPDTSNYTGSIAVEMHYSLSEGT